MRAAAVDEEADDLNAVDDACAAVSEEGVSVARFEGCAFWDGAVFVDKVEAVREVQGVGLCRRLRSLSIADMVRIAISAEAFAAIVATMPLGSVSYENAVNTGMASG